MKTTILANIADEPCESTDSSSDYSVLDNESPNGKNMDQLNEKIIKQESIIRDLKAKLTDAKATIKDKNELIELIKQNKQLQDENTVLQTAFNLNKNLAINNAEANSTDSARIEGLEKKTTGNADSQALQKQFDDSQSQTTETAEIICQLKATISGLQLKMDEKDKEMAILKAKSNTDEVKLRAEIAAELEEKAKICEVEPIEGDGNLVRYDHNIKSSEITGGPVVFLNYSTVPNIKSIKVGNQINLAIVEDIPSAGSDWIVILRRFDGTLSFEKQLTCGFGDLYGEFWFGLESIYKMTLGRRHELYIELVDFDGVTAYAKYDNFQVDSKETQYALKSLGAYSGTAGDALRDHQGGGQLCHWWSGYQKESCCLTGPYLKKGKNVLAGWGMYWGNWFFDRRYPLKACKMLIRPYSKN